MTNWQLKKRYFANHLATEKMSRLCRLLKISRRTGYDWKELLSHGGVDLLLREKSRGRPLTPTDENVRDAVIALREKYGWNEKTLKHGLKDYKIDASFYRVRSILKEAKLLAKAPARRPPANKRYCRPWPNHLWHGDWRDFDGGTLFSLQDDYSRYVVAAMEFDHQSTENALFVARQAVRTFGAPFQVITDHGSEFWNNRLDIPNSFGETLSVLGAEQILARKKHPQTNGKLENWFGVFKHQEWRFDSLEEYRRHYNFEQPNRAINWQKPYQRYNAFVL